MINTLVKKFTVTDEGMKHLKTAVEKFTATDEGMKHYRAERLAIEITALIGQIMDEKGVSKKMLAEKLRWSEGYVTWILDGPVDIAIGTVSDVMWALDSTLHATAGPMEPKRAKI